MSFFQQTDYHDILHDTRTNKYSSPDVTHVSNDSRVFSGTDITAYVSLPGLCNYKLGTLSLISISTHRDKFPVSTLGRVNALGYTAGHRVIGGTMVFATLDKSVWSNMMRLVQDNRRNKFPNDLFRGYPDDLPPYDITITFLNEFGHAAVTGLIGVTLLDEGETYGVDEPEVKETYSYMALDRIPLQEVDLGIRAPLGGPGPSPVPPNPDAPPPPPDCDVVLTPSTQHVPASGGSYTLNIVITDPPGDLAISHSWITIPESHHITTSTSVTVNVEANPSTNPRSGIVGICEKVLTINQDGIEDSGPCMGTTANPSTHNSPASGDSFNVTITAGNASPMGVISDSGWDNHQSYFGDDGKRNSYSHRCGKYQSQ
jgi:hypothetical protein